MIGNPSTPLLMETTDAELAGDLALRAGSDALIVFAHGSGSSRSSDRNRQVAADLQGAGFCTLLFDLLTEEEARIDEQTAEYRFDVPLIGRRLTDVLDWLARAGETETLEIGLFGASTGAAAALLAAAERPRRISAIVSRGGRPDLAMGVLGRVEAPTLLIVGERDEEVIRLNEVARSHMRAACELEIVPGASHLFEEPGALDHVAVVAAGWFQRHM